MGRIYKNHQKNNNIIKNITAVVMSFLLIIQSGYPLLEAHAQTNKQADQDDFVSYTASKGNVVLGESAFTQEQVLGENEDGTYTLSITLRSGLFDSNQNEESNQSKNDYFTAPQSGRYLIELWGGSGADGQDSNYSAGGKGGKGGHIYGIADLNAGDTLYYVLGGNGTQTKNTNTGGGANGGGNHGDVGSYKVGGGGGYSAVFRFPKGTFNEKYLDENGHLKKQLEESDRISNYIMIAGGGGGGGAGNSFSLTSQITGTPDGGSGGNIESNFGNLYGAGYDVEGTFYSGSNGASSGRPARYVGLGGTNIPGALVGDIAWIDGSQANDWKGTYNADLPGGFGSSGNMRGGGGGAGFCGGSGGNMRSLLEAVQVGGGGGGSSFTAREIDTQLEKEEEQKLIGNTSTSGGSVHIEYIGTEARDGFDFAGEVSEYFQIEDVHASGNADVAVDGSHFSIRHAYLYPDNSEAGEKKGEFTVSITVRPKDGFAGGNGVPVLKDNRLFWGYSEDTEPGSRLSVRECATGF